MRIILRTLIFIIFIPLVGSTQITEVSMGAAYSEQAYFKLSTCEVTIVKNDAWDIAFSNIGQQDAGIMINESGSLMGTALSLYASPTSTWEETPTDLDSLSDDLRLFNPDVSWTEGAFNTLKDPAGGPFDYGWGSYDPMQNAVVGDQIYILKQRDGSYLKLQILSAGGPGYELRYASPDGSNEVTAFIPRSNRPILHYSILEGAVVEMPTDYDLIFQRYSEFVQDIMGTDFAEYIVSGVLLAPGTQAVVATDVDPMTIDHDDYFNDYSSTVNVIGHDWKEFDLNAGGFVIDSRRVQFIKTVEGEYYKIAFYDFEGSQTGTTTLEKFLEGATSTEDQLDNGNPFQVFPNPASDHINITNPEGLDVVATLYNNQGQVLLSQRVTTNQLDLPAHLANGSYQLVLFANDKSYNQSVILSR